MSLWRVSACCQCNVRNTVLCCAAMDRAQYNMRKITRDGVAGKADMKAAAAWFLSAAKQGYAKVQNHIGMRYARGDGVERMTRRRSSG